ncbi:MAG: pantoate--beta-alanine ligase, partial [Mucilaginibacter polytrichastri]|nr:pantoate--beta-alanine ligase [Mucilaginibacter polytrichastri]
MEIITTRKALKETLDQHRRSGRSVGIVPTMGALHAGHISLVERALAGNDVVVCTIFVNPTQFNDPNDLERYPRPIENDKKMLAKTACHILFLPDADEMYPEGEPAWNLDLEGLDTVLEGAHRPGHYQGVTQVVYKLLSAGMPCTAYFGQKDYQQFRVLAHMVDVKKMEVNLVRCAIVREPDGLAMSSRNVHLSPGEHERALVLSRTLSWLQQHYTERDALSEARAMIERTPGVELDYLEIVDGNRMEPVSPLK